ncbi:MAG: DUF5681 domain-containing protein [Pseudomonadota bacterium]
MPIVAIRRPDVVAPARQRLTSEQLPFKTADIIESSNSDQPAEISDASPKRTKKQKQSRSDTNWDDDGNYRVGRNKPPVEHRFKPGQSGNPRGPKRGVKGVVAQAKKIFSQKVPVKMRGKTYMLDAVGVGLTHLYEKAGKGDLKAIELIFKFAREFHPEGSVGESQAIPPEMAELIDQMLTDAGFPARPFVRSAHSSLNDEDADQ